MKRILDMIFYIAVIIMMVSGAYCGITELFMIDQSTIPKWVDVTAGISGLLSLLYVSVAYYLKTKHSKRSKKNRNSGE